MTKLRLLTLSAVFAAAIAGPAARSAGAQAYTYFPTSATNDGKMLALAGSPLKTLAGQTVDVAISAPSTATSLEIGLFDGDTGRAPDGTINAALGNWDLGTTQMIYTLYADPTGQGTGSTVIGQWTGNTANALSGPLWAADSATMPNNGWWNVTITPSASAQSDAGDYSYFLRLQLQSTTANVESSLKLRTTGQLAMRPGVWGFVGAMRQTRKDGPILYPGWDGVFTPPAGSTYWLTAPTTYDGEWEFLLDVSIPIHELSIWDGDMDFGTKTLTTSPSNTTIASCTETNDSNTPDSVPFFSTSPDAVAESAKTAGGTPPDNNNIDIFRRGDCTTYDVVDTLNNVYSNTNSSGNQEWELFRVTSVQSSTTADHIANVTSFPPGQWKVQVHDLDLANLNFWYMPVPVCGVDGLGNSNCPPTGSLGDYVWFESDGDGIQEAGEAPLSGIDVELWLDTDGDGVLDANDIYMATDVTDSNGLYLFDGLAAGKYLVVIPNGEVDGALSSFTASTKDNNAAANDGVDSDGLLTVNASSQDVVVAATTLDIGEVDLTIDFGFGPSGGAGGVAVGDTVWHDSNDNGQQDPGEVGLDGVIIKVYLDWSSSTGPAGDNTFNSSDLLIATVTTDANGHYLVNVPVSGASVGYFIVVDSSNFTGSGELVGWTQSSASYGAETGDATSPVSVNHNKLSAYYAAVTGATSNLTGDFGYHGQIICLEHDSSNPNPAVGGVIEWSYDDNGDLVVRVYLNKSYADTAYGSSTGGTGWPGGGRGFKHLVTSDNLQVRLENASGTVVADFTMDLLGIIDGDHYDTAGISGNGGSIAQSDGSCVSGCQYVTSVRTSIGENLADPDVSYVGWSGYPAIPPPNGNNTPYSPTNNSTYTNSSDPDWIWDTWYEATIDTAVFGTSSLGDILVTSFHSSPAKTGGETPPLQPCE